MVTVQCLIRQSYFFGSMLSLFSFILAEGSGGSSMGSTALTHDTGGNHGGASAGFFDAEVSTTTTGSTGTDAFETTIWESSSSGGHTTASSKINNTHDGGVHSGVSLGASAVENNNGGLSGQGPGGDSAKTDNGASTTTTGSVVYFSSTFSPSGHEAAGVHQSSKVPTTVGDITSSTGTAPTHISKSGPTTPSTGLGAEAAQEAGRVATDSRGNATATLIAVCVTALFILIAAAIMWILRYRAKNRVVVGQINGHAASTPTLYHSPATINASILMSEGAIVLDACFGDTTVEGTSRDATLAASSGKADEEYADPYEEDMIIYDLYDDSRPCTFNGGKNIDSVVSTCFVKCVTRQQGCAVIIVFLCFLVSQGGMYESLFSFTVSYNAYKHVFSNANTPRRFPSFGKNDVFFHLKLLCALKRCINSYCNYRTIPEKFAQSYIAFQTETSSNSSTHGRQNVAEQHMEYGRLNTIAPGSTKLLSQSDSGCSTYDHLQGTQLPPINSGFEGEQNEYDNMDHSNSIPSKQEYDMLCTEMLPPTPACDSTSGGDTEDRYGFL